MRDLTPATALRTPGCSLKGRGKTGRFPAAELTTNGTTVTTNFTYDAEGKLASASNGTTSYSVLYDGDGNKISTTINGNTTILVGNYYEWSSDATWKKYYSANGQNIAVRDQNGVQYLYGDNLASVRGWSNSNGTSYAKRTACGSQSYMPWGEDGTSTQYGTAGKAISDRKYTGQKSISYINLGLYDYGSRWYDAALGRFIQPDSIIPDPYNPLSWDRYAYGYNNPSRFSDPSGHFPFDEILDALFLVYDASAILIEGPTPVNQAALAADLVCAAIPYGTGGGLAVRLGGEAAIEGVTHLPAGIRALQVAEKGAQFAIGTEGKSLDLSGESGAGNVKRNSINPNNIFIPENKTNQVPQRGWSLDSIKKTIANPSMTRSTLDNPNIINRANGNPVTYFYRKDGHYVVIDNVTHQVVQISDLNKPGWIDEMTNKPIQPVGNE